MTPPLSARALAQAPVSPIAADVADGLTRPRKALPAYLFYDEEGSHLYERITTLPEYYPTRTERAILETHADAIVALAAGPSHAALHLIELGAGTATKTQVLLRAAVRAQGHCLFVPIDVSRSALDEAARRLHREEPRVHVRPICRMHTEAFPLIARIEPQQAVAFLGSSIGNYEDAEARSLLCGLRRSLHRGATLVLGTDLVKSPDILIPAYDDAQGVTAAFNKNVLARINRELGGQFDLDRFRHVAVWNAPASRIEMHLESCCTQSVAIEQLGIRVPFTAGERIHTESSVKYDMPRVEALFRAAGFTRIETFTDAQRWFAVHVAEASADR